MSLLKNFMINFQEIMENISELIFQCITDMPNFFSITYSENIIKTNVLH